MSQVKQAFKGKGEMDFVIIMAIMMTILIGCSSIPI